MLKMGTRAASFSAKIRNLQEYHHRLLNGITPYPSTPDIINVLKFFSQALLTILRDVPCIPIDLIRDPSRDSIRIGFFPNLDYRNLFYTLSGMLDSFASIQAALSSNAPVVFEYLLHALVCLVPFLEHELMDSLPLSVASTISLNFISHQDIIDMLCYNILPFTLYHEAKENDLFDFANASIPSILMTVLSHTDSLALHSQLLECLMRLKANIIQDLLVVIAYGTGKARHASVELLFQYWPGLNPSPLDRRALVEKHVAWKPLTCQNETCQNTLNNEAVKICFAQIDAAAAAATAAASAATNISGPSGAAGGGGGGGTTSAGMTALPATIDLKGRPPIPLLICIECAELVREQNSLNKNIKSQDILLNVLHPMTEISYNCESKTCLSGGTAGPPGTGRMPPYQHGLCAQQQAPAVVTCFSTECTSFNCNKPVRLCLRCHQQRHPAPLPSPAEPDATPGSSSVEPGTPPPPPPPIHASKPHLVQEHLQSFWELPSEAQHHFTEAVIALLREAAAIDKSTKESERYMRTHGTGAYTGGLGNLGGDRMTGGMATAGGAGLGGPGGPDGANSGPAAVPGASSTGGAPGAPAVNSDASDSTIEERQLLSRYGIWLLIGLVDPAQANTNERLELLGRMLAMLCQWFHNTACLPDDQAGSALERIKSESIHGWLMKVIQHQFRLFANCLVPNPPDHAQIGGHWECWPSMTNQIKEGFKRLLCLVPYDIITPEIWSYIMPFWMESFRYDLAEEELSELKILLSKVLDPDLSPLGLEADVMYRFISRSFDSQMPEEQEQALSWLQILTLLEIPVPMYLLEQMFLAGIKSFMSLREQTARQPKPQAEEEPAGPIPQSASMSSVPALSLDSVAQSQLSCYVLMLDIMVKQFEYLPDQPNHKGFNEHGKNYQPLNLARMRKDDSDFGFNTLVILHEMVQTSRCTVGPHTCLSASERPPDTSQMFKPGSVLNECYFCELCSIWYQLSLQIMQMFAPVIETAVMADAGFDMPLPSADCTETSLLALSGSAAAAAFPDPGLQLAEDESELLAQLTLSERVTLKFLQELQVHTDPDVLYHLLQCLKLLTLHCGVLANMAKQESKTRFFLHCQQKYLVLSLWRLLQAEFSQISQIAVPLLLHCIALPGGLTVLINTIDAEFGSEHWCTRFAAIERVATFSQFLDQNSMKNSASIQSALSSLFIHMIQALDDINSAVAQRALMALEQMRAASIKIYVMCLEIQFDLVMVDRCLVLSSLLQLFNHLNERRILTWEFFLNRFDALFLEAQVLPGAAKSAPGGSGHGTPILGESGASVGSELTRDLRNTNVHSETYKKKVVRAQEALAQVHIRRSLLPHHFGGRNEKRHLLSVAGLAAGIISSAKQRPELGGSTAGHSGVSSSGAPAAEPSAAPSTGSSTGPRSGLFNKLQQQATGQAAGRHRSEKAKNLTAAASSQLAINRKSSKLAALTGSAFPNNFFQDSGQSKQDMAQEELQLFSVVHRTLDDLDYCDQETLHLLVFLFMQFLSWPDPQHPTDDKSLTRTQMIVLRHLNTLLGYSMSENVFLLNAHDLRRKSVFSAFLVALPDVLDLNLSVGSLLLSLVFPVLVYCPAGHRFIYVSDIDQFSPNYSIWLLPGHLRRAWLCSLIVILYKHNYVSSSINAKFVQHLIQITQNTLESALEHKCNPEAAWRRRSREHKETTPAAPGAVSAPATAAATEDVIKTSDSLTGDDTITSMAGVKMAATTRPSTEEQLDSAISKLMGQAKQSGSVQVEAEPKKMPEAEVPAPEPSNNVSEGDEEEEEAEMESPALERLLPVAGQLSQTVRATLQSRPCCYPSVLQSPKPSSTAGKQPPADGPAPPVCCCCCAAASGRVCCLDYQQTIEAFRALPPVKPRNDERLLPIGPRPHHSRSHTVASRSAERAASSGPGKTWRRSQLVRQHTTIVAAAEPGGGAAPGLPASKSMDSMDKPRLVIAKLRAEPEPEPKRSQIVLSPTSPIKKHPGEKPQPAPLPPPATPGKALAGSRVHQLSMSPCKSASSPNLNGVNAPRPAPPTQTQPSSPSKESPDSLTKSTSAAKPGKSKRNKKKTKNKQPEQTNGQPSPEAPGGESSAAPGADGPPQPQPTESAAKPQQTKTAEQGRSNDSTNSDISYQQYELCNCCGLPVEKFDEHELGLCLVALATFVHRNPGLAAPLLPQILKLTSRYALRCVYPWQMESNVHLPGNTASIARQLIRCTLHQLNSNGIFRQLFQTHSGDTIMFRSVAISLADFVELNQVTPLRELFEALSEDKQLPPLGQILLTLSNVATYFECVFVDYNVTQSCSLSTLSPVISSQYGANVPVMGASIVANQPWSELMAPLENYLRRLAFNLAELAPNLHNLVPVMRVLLALFKVPGIGAHRSLLDPVAKLVGHVFQHSPVLLEHVRDLCIHCNRAFVRDRDRFCMARTFAQELVAALRFRTQAPDENVFALVQWALEDAGGSLPYSVAVQSLERNQNRQLGLAGITVELPSTNATECLRCYIPELLEFIGDVHALAKLRSNFQGTSIHLNQETLGANLKAGVAQFLALELTRIGGSDSKAITKYLPWLYSLPSIQNGPKEFSECIGHVRLLAWILLGSLQHTALMKCHPSHSSLLVSQPIPLDVGNHVAEHVHVILAGFGSESKSSVIHMSALFYAFLLCQLWTVYCEQLASQNPPGSDAAHQNILVLTDFWTKVTPGVLQIISHSITEVPQLADTITLHFLSLMETLMECNSEVLARLLPLWLPFFNSYAGQLTDHVSSRLKTLISWPVPAQTKNDAMMLSTVLIRWLQRVQARMSQIEIQSSTVTQFYCL